MSEDHFLANEQKILNDIKSRRNKVLETGLVSKLPKDGEVQAGYIIYLTHNEIIEYRVNEFSLKLSEALDGNSILYGSFCGYRNRSNIHTTITTYNKNNVSSFNPDKHILYKLSNIAEKSINSFLKTDKCPILNYSQFIYNDEIVIAEPENSSGFFKLMEMVVRESRGKIGSLRSTWGKHITIGRFTKDISIDKLEEFKELMKDPSFLDSSINDEFQGVISLNAGHFLLSNKEFNLVPYSAFYF